MAKYINPYTDFGFKKLFGEEGNKALLIDFLNQLLPLHHQIADLTFQNVEQANFSKQQREDYEKSRLSYIGIKQVTETAEKDGLKRGLTQGKTEIAKEMKKEGFDTQMIIKLTGLSVTDVENL